jgi:hypothetical protein
MTLHHGYPRHHVVPNDEQEIPASDHSCSSKSAQRVGYLKSSAHREQATLPDHSPEQSSQRSLNLLKVLPAQFKLHKPPPPCRLPSSRCI